MNGTDVINDTMQDAMCVPTPSPTMDPTAPSIEPTTHQPTTDAPTRYIAPRDISGVERWKVTVVLLYSLLLIVNWL